MIGRLDKTPRSLGRGFWPLVATYIPTAVTYLNRVYNYLTQPVIDVGAPKVRVIDLSRGDLTLLERLEAARVTTIDEEGEEDDIVMDD